MKPWCVLAALAALAGAADFIDEGLKALDGGKPAEAEQLFRQAVAADTRDYTAHFNLALALSLEKKDSEAIAELRRTLELKPGLYQADLNLGALLLRNEKAAEALPVLAEASGARPKEARPNLYYAEALLGTGDAAHAEERFRVAIEADAKSGEAHTGLAHALVAEGKPEQAEAEYRAAAAIDPGLRNQVLEMGGVWERAGNREKAISIYREFPASGAAEERLTALLAEKGDYAAALPGLELAVKSNPTVNTRLALAEAYQETKQPDKAIDQLDLAMAGDPGNFDLRMRLGKALRDERKLDAAAQQFFAATKIRPDAVEAWNELASAWIVGEHYEEGLGALDRVKALGREIPGDLYYRALSLDHLRQLKPALEAYRNFLAAAQGKYPDEEFKARQRVRIIENELKRR